MRLLGTRTVEYAKRAKESFVPNDALSTIHHLWSEERQVTKSGRGHDESKVVTFKKAFEGIDSRHWAS